MSDDLINGLFEFAGGLFVLNHCRVLLNDRLVRGVSIISTLFFPSWGLWNLYYYPSLAQWWSFAGGVVLVSTNLLYISMLVYFSREHIRLSLDIWWLERNLAR